MQVSINRALVGGFLGTLAMTALMYFVAPMMGVHMDIAGMLAPLLGGSFWAGMTMHFVNGTLIFPTIYAYGLYSWLPGGPATKGAAFGVLLWLVAQTVVMPMMGAGLFSAAAGGMMAAAGSLVGHLLYGGILGEVAGPGKPIALPV